jgi:hypothetical protein
MLIVLLNILIICVVGAICFGRSKNLSATVGSLIFSRFWSC